MSNKTTNADDLTELSEVLIDQLSQSTLETFLGENAASFIEAVPAGKLILATGKIFNSAKSYHRMKMLTVFLKSMESGEKTLGDFTKLDERSREDIRGIVITQLDLQTDERQAEAIGLIVNAYLAKKVDRLIFIGTVSEIKNTNPLLYYFSVDSLMIDRLHTNFGKPIIKGNVRLLPAVFYNTSATETSHGWDAIPGQVSHPTSMGETFFKYAYEPMLEKYQI